MSLNDIGSQDEANRRERAMNGAHGAMLLFLHEGFRGRVWPQAERLARPIDWPKGAEKTGR